MSTAFGACRRGQPDCWKPIVGDGRTSILDRDRLEALL
jgi:hypothetical protein